MRILVTGSSGFVGKHLCRRLIKDGHKVVQMNSGSAKIAPGAPYWEVAQGHRPDQIWHLAAWTQAGRFCLDHPAEQWLINQHINLDILKFWQQHQPQAKFISFGTSCAYDPYLKMTEENYLNGQPAEDLMAYAMTKRMLQVGVEAMAQQYGMRWLTIVPSTIYGPGYMARSHQQLHFIYDLVRKIVAAKKGGPAPVLWGDGHQVRQLIHVDDLLRYAMPMSLDREGIYNIGGITASIREFAQMICSLVDYDPNLIEYDLDAYVGTEVKVMSSAKLCQDVAVPDLTTIWVGLEQIIAEMSQ